MHLKPVISDHPFQKLLMQLESTPLRGLTLSANAYLTRRKRFPESGSMRALMSYIGSMGMQDNDTSTWRNNDKLHTLKNVIRGTNTLTEEELVRLANGYLLVPDGKIPGHSPSILIDSYKHAVDQFGADALNREKFIELGKDYIAKYEAALKHVPEDKKPEERKPPVKAVITIERPPVIIKPSTYPKPGKTKPAAIKPAPKPKPEPKSLITHEISTQPVNQLTGWLNAIVTHVGRSGIVLRDEQQATLEGLLDKSSWRAYAEAGIADEFKTKSNIRNEMKPVILEIIAALEAITLEEDMPQFRKNSEFITALYEAACKQDPQFILKQVNGGYKRTPYSNPNEALGYNK